MEIKITEKQYNFINEKAPSFKVEFAVSTNYSIDIVDGFVIFHFNDIDTYDDFMNALDLAIVHDGMINQDVVNDVGIELYKIYDSIIYRDND
ncbi:hypothetical protein IU403_07685 [Aerococcaceae bacterium zg-BR22]|uniref:hypothetical protein n=1 Tax=Aerococcaceae bacterium zg-1292 TaxID=2774330 RepID=UPI0040642556|nr:hypothetical protein [Aerococcaceae bacterium zg-BR22]